MWRPDNHLHDDIKWMKVLNWGNGVTHILLTVMWLYWFFLVNGDVFPFAGSPGQMSDMTENYVYIFQNCKKNLENTAAVTQQGWSHLLPQTD